MGFGKTDRQQEAEVTSKRTMKYCKSCAMRFPLPIRESEEVAECDICHSMKQCIVLDSVHISPSIMKEMQDEVSGKNGVVAQ